MGVVGCVRMTFFNLLTSVRGIMDTKTMPSNTAHDAGGDPALLLENVRFRWPNASQDTLSLALFTMKKGERVFISGPSGCGKSTLLALIAGIILPDCGTVMVNGCDLRAMSSARRDAFRGDHIGFIFQQFNLVPYLSIIDNVLIPCHFSKIRQSKASKGGKSSTTTAQELLMSLDLGPALWGKKVHTLSIGQQQRVAAARALIGQPELIIADEPTSALDYDHRSAFLHLLLEECDALDTSLLFVSHDTSLAELFPRRVSMAELNHVEKDPE